jgi:hypothetical protein
MTAFANVGGLMSKKAQGRPRGDRDDVTVKVDRSLVARAKVIAARREVSLAKLLSDWLEGPLESAWDEMVREMDAAKRRPKGGK